MTKRSPLLDRLEALAGCWRIEIRHPSLPDVIEGRASIDWLEDGAFLRVHSEVTSPDFPVNTAIIGADGDKGTYTFAYYDSRGVSRILDMSFDGGVWRLERTYPAFSQRFVGTLSPDGKTIAASWEKSVDGKTWERDFDMTYVRLD